MARAISTADFSYNSIVLEDELSSISMDFTVPEADITAFSDAWQNFLAGKPTATLSISGAADLAASQGDVTIFSDLGLVSKAYDFEPDGTTGYNGFGFPTSYSVQCTVNDAIKYSATIRHTGGAAANDAAAPTRA